MKTHILKVCPWVQLHLHNAEWGAVYAFHEQLADNGGGSNVFRPITLRGWHYVLVLMGHLCVSGYILYGFILLTTLHLSNNVCIFIAIWNHQHFHNIHYNHIHVHIACHWFSAVIKAYIYPTQHAVQWSYSTFNFLNAFTNLCTLHQRYPAN